MQAFATILRYLLLVLVWFLSATFLVCVIYYLFSKHQVSVTWPFLKEYGILLAILLVLYYLVNLIYNRNEESY